MKLNKIIFTSDRILSEKLISFFGLKEVKKEQSFEIYEGNRELFKDEENMILVYFENFEEAIIYVEENYDIFKIIFIGFAEIMGNTELVEGDVIIPNTFINNDKKAIFIDYAVGEDYDLNNFGLILNGICFSGKLEGEDNEFLADIKDNEIYNLLEEVGKEDEYIGKTVVIKGIYIDDKAKSTENIVNIIDLVL